MTVVLPEATPPLPEPTVPPSITETPVPAPTMWITEATDASSLAPHVPAWDDLARHAVESNAFFESWMLLPALDIFGPGKNLLFLLIYRVHPQKPKGPPLLCGLFPLSRSRTYKGLPISCLSIWEHGNCFLGTPLLRKGYIRECLDTLFDWLANDPRSSPFFELRSIAADGPIYQHLIDLFRSRSTPTYTVEASTRAFLRRHSDAEAYLHEAMSSNKRRDLQRKQRRLMELGKLEYVTLTPQDNIEIWQEHFLRLEASGWKGQGGTALACREADCAFFRQVARQGFQRGQLWMHGLFLNAQPIALRCNFLSKPGSFFFKPAFDENYGRYSPGVLVELDAIRQLHADPQLLWMDSCTSPENELLNALWLDRRILQTLLVATGRGLGQFTLSTLSLFRWLNRKRLRCRISRPQV